MRYYILEIPREFCPESKDNFQIFRCDHFGNYKYVMEYGELEQYCKEYNWPCPRRDQTSFDFDEHLEFLVIQDAIPENQ